MDKKYKIIDYGTLKEALSELWVVEDTNTGYKYVTDAMSAYHATFHEESTLWKPRKLSNIKTYPLRNAGLELRSYLE